MTPQQLFAIALRLFSLWLLIAAFNASAQEAPPLLKSIARGDEAAVRKLATADNVNLVSHKGNASATPLITAVMTAVNGRGDPSTMLRIIDILFERGADPNLAIPLNNRNVSAVELLEVLDRTVAMGKAADDDDVRLSKLIKTLLATMHQHGGVADSKKVADMVQEFMQYRINAYKAACTADLRNWTLAQESYYMAHNSYPKQLKEVGPSLENHAYQADGTSYRGVFSCKSLPDSMKIEVSEDTQPAAIGF